MTESTVYRSESANPAQSIQPSVRISLQNQQELIVSVLYLRI